PPVPAQAPQFVRDVLGPMIAGVGDTLPVSALPNDGVYPSGTTRWEKRNIALEIPEWDADLCIQCGKCSFVCPHAVIRSKVYPVDALVDAPDEFRSTGARFKEFSGWKYSLQVAPEDCTGCALCVEVCPAKDKRQVGRKAINMVPQAPIRERENRNWDYFLGLPDLTRDQVALTSVKNSQ
ncbi:MAG TPA: 4Fe-4S binding protein, partial [Roseiflexaceae bacterium]|nr:4Fe-4S binding protein [Roseiflexaceae bacterium]